MAGWGVVSMSAWWRRLVAGLVMILAGAGLVIVPLAAQADRSDWTCRFQGAVQGGMVMTGNTFQASNGKAANADNITGQPTKYSYVTRNTSATAPLALPADATVVKAVLYVYGSQYHPPGSADYDDPKRFKFRVAGSTGYSDKTASEVDNLVFDNEAHGNEHQAILDVTNDVKAAGSGTYGVADTPVYAFPSYFFGGWALAVVYSSPSSPQTQVSLCDRWLRTDNTSADATYDLGWTPMASPARVAMFHTGVSGDPGHEDAIQLEGKRTGDAVNPNPNSSGGVTRQEVANGTCEQFGKDIAGRDPQGPSTGWDGQTADCPGIDVDTMNVTTVAPATRTFTVRAGAEEETAWGVLGFTYEPSPDARLGLARDAKLNDANGDALGNVGETISYTYAVTNSGNVTMSGIAIADDKDAAGSTTCAKTTLAPGESAACTAKYTVTAADVAAGTVRNTATATGKDPKGAGVVSPPSAKDVPTAELPAKLELGKAARLDDRNGDARANAGETIAYTYTVRNSGTVALTNLAIKDDKVPAAGATCARLSLQPDESTTCTGTYTVTSADADAGKVRTTATAGADDPSGKQVVSPPGSAEVLTAVAAAVLDLAKDGRLNDANSDNLGNPGETIDYTYTVTNNGTVPVSGLTITDDKIAAVFIACGKTTLAAAESTICTATYTVRPEDVAARKVRNVATTQGRDPDGNPVVSPQASKEVPAGDVRPSAAALRVGKQITKNPAPVAGSPGTYEIEYEVTVTNSGQGAGTYSLRDEVQYGTGVDLTKAVIAGKSPAGLTVRPDWNGRSQPVVAENVNIAEASAHVYTVTNWYTVDTAKATNQSVDCILDTTETGTGTRNRASITFAGGGQGTSTCIPIPAVTVSKQLMSASKDATGKWNAVYRVTVANKGAAPAIYDLDDRFRFGEGTVVSSAVVTGKPTGANIDPAWNGQGKTRMVSNMPIDQTSTQTYELTVSAAPPWPAAPASTDCTLDTGEAGTGLLNEAAIVTDGRTARAQACQETAESGFKKVVTQQPVPVAGQPGVYEMKWELRVFNYSAAEQDYTLLNDTLKFGSGITVQSASVANTTPGTLTARADWDGRTRTVVTDAGKIAAQGQHVWTVTVRFSVTDSATADSATCKKGSSTGLLNTASVTTNGRTEGAEECVSAPIIKSEKQLVSATPSGNGTIVLVYAVIVTSSGGSGTYTLDDKLRFGTGVTIQQSIAGNEVPGDIATEPGWDGLGNTRIVTDKAIGPSGAHVYLITVTAKPPAEFADRRNADCTLDAGETGTGYLNESTLTVAGLSDKEEACHAAAFLDFTKKISAQPAPVPGQPGTYTVEYELIMSNAGNPSSRYTLTDKLRFGAGVTVQSAKVTTIPAGAGENPGGWNGTTQTTVTKDQDIGANTTHTWKVQATYKVEPTLTEAAGDCTLDTGETGTGTLNEASVEVGNRGTIQSACATVSMPSAVTTAKKILSAGTDANGLWTIKYQLDVTNSNGAGKYTLDDELRYAAQVAVRTAKVTGQPAGVTPNPAWDGKAARNLVTDQAIAAGATHTYEVTVTANVTAGTGNVDSTDCTLQNGETGTAFLNEATTTVDGRAGKSRACEPLPSVTLTKKVSKEPVPVGQVDNTFDMEYEVTVTNTGKAATTYTGVDELRYGKAIQAQPTPVITNTTPGGLTAQAGWNGASQATFVTDQAIEAGATHVWTVKVRFTVDAPNATIDDADCKLDPGETGTGTLNTASVTYKGGKAEDKDCAPITPVTLTKERKVMTPNGDGTWDIAYEVTVANTGAPTTYDLSDKLRFSPAVQVISAKLAGVPADIAADQNWDGQATTKIVTGQAIGRTVRHVYTISVRVRLPLDAGGKPEPSDCRLDPDEAGTGLLNEALATSKGGTSTKQACDPIPSVTFAKSVLNQPAPVDGQPGTYEIVYQLQVTNSGAAPAAYDLADKLSFGQGLTVAGKPVVTKAGPGAPDPSPAYDGAADTSVVKGGTIAANTVHAYRLAVRYTLDTAKLTAASGDCRKDAEETGTGTLNEATLTINGQKTEGQACAEVSTVLIEKKVASVTANPDGTSTAEYDLVVRNPGSASKTYEASDQLRYGAGITISSASVASTPAGVAFNKNWNGIADTALSPAQSIAAGGTHTYRLKIVAKLPATLDPKAGDCTLDSGEIGTGLLNEGSILVDGKTSRAQACQETAAITLDKKAGEVKPVPGYPGLYRITYDLTVTNTSSAESTYSLTDQLRFGKGVTVQELPVVTNVTPGALAAVAGFDAAGQPKVTQDQKIAGKASHVWRVDAFFKIDSASYTATSGDCTVDPGENGSTGTRNEATVTFTGGQSAKEDCKPAGLAGQVKQKPKTLVSATDKGSGITELVYEIAVENSGASEGRYTLDDALRFGAGTTIHTAAVTTRPAGVTVNSSWNNSPVDKNIVTDQVIAGGAVHVYRVTVQATVPLRTADAKATDCKLDDGETGTGLLNTSTVTVNGQPDTSTACKETPSIELTKKVRAGTPSPVAGQPDTFEILYDVTVTNGGAGEGRYSLTDELKYGKGVNIQPAPSVTSTQPGSLTPVAAWNGTGQTKVADGQVIAGRSSHVWTVKARYKVDKSMVTSETIGCVRTGTESGTGTLNETRVDVNGQSDTQLDCGGTPVVVHEPKKVVSMTAKGGGVTEIVYELRVRTVGKVPGQYTLDDQLRFAGGVQVQSAAVTTAPAGVTPSADWNGTTKTNVVTSQAIPGDTAHVYRVTVTAKLPATADAKAADCKVDAGETGTGLLNEATVTVDGNKDVQSDCREISSVLFTKTMTQKPKKVGTNEYEAVYELRVQNTGAAASAYDLVDVLKYGDGTVVSAATTVNTQPGGLAQKPGGWDGRTKTTLTNGEPIAANATHVWTTTVRFRITQAITAGARDCVLAPAERGTGTLNQATLLVGGQAQNRESCGEVEPPTVDPDPKVTVRKALVSALPKGDGTYDLVYEVKVTNEGGGTGKYTLDDSLRYGTGVTVLAGRITATGTMLETGWDGRTRTRIVTDKEIAGGATHTFTISLNAQVPAAVPAGETDCALDGAEKGTGTLNTATLTGASTGEARACTELPSTTITKKHLGSSPVAGQPGTYDLAYQIKVTNAGAGPGSYDLDDTLTFGDGVQVLAAAIGDPKPATPQAGWDGRAKTRMATAVTIGPRTEHAWLVMVRVKVPPAISARAANCTMEGDEKGTGLRNQATAVANGNKLNGEACTVAGGTATPTADPTGKPSPDPTGKPSPDPTGKPSPDPTGKPSPDPTGKPSPDPTGKPSPDPTGKPSPDPTGKPSPDPTGKPSPDPTGKPGPDPTGKPGPDPTGKPGPDPTGKPGPDPTGKPGPDPTGKPGPDPTGTPGPDPTSKPTANPTMSPTTNPTGTQVPPPAPTDGPGPTEQPYPPKPPVPPGPPPMPVTGSTLMPFLMAGGVLLILGGALLLATSLWRRRVTYEA
ncbi:DUF7507 domain-containing protein [Longispora albida]|uniref:DUF7507 domain-containing protein n=1 Tax=Longispora albida TaxID=203523 RepID=UPI00039C275A|nr:hypothetical protein [Longispora albida]